MFAKSILVCRGSGNVLSCRESLSAGFGDELWQWFNIKKERIDDFKGIGVLPVLDVPENEIVSDYQGKSIQFTEHELLDEKDLLNKTQGCNRSLMRLPIYKIYKKLIFKPNRLVTQKDLASLTSNNVWSGCCLCHLGVATEGTFIKHALVKAGKTNIELIKHDTQFEGQTLLLMLLRSRCENVEGEVLTYEYNEDLEFN